MWSDLGDPNHEEGTPNDRDLFCSLLRALRSREYRNRYFGHWSHFNFAIGRHRDCIPELEDFEEPLIWIELDRSTNLLLVGQRGAESRWGMWKENGYWVRVGRWAYCNCEQALGLIDSIIAESEARNGREKGDAAF